MKPYVGQTLELEIIKLVHGGWGLARHEGFVVFVKGVLPGEQIIAVIREVKKNHANAELVALEQASNARVSHVWPEAEWVRPAHQRAGGADYGHIDRPEQLTFKTDILRDSLERFGHVDPDIAALTSVAAVGGETDGLHWRTRVSLQVNDEGIAGPYAENSHTVVPVETLPLAVEEIEQLGAHRGSWSGHSRIRLIRPTDGSARLVIDRQRPDLIVETVGQHRFQLSDQGFWQVHSRAADTLFSQVKRLALDVEVQEGATHLDLYGGVGLFARALLDAYGENTAVVTVEADSDASHNAGINLSDAAGARAVASTAKAYLTRLHGQESPIGTVVLDPPRSGAEKEVISELLRLSPKAIIYVACDPVALGRDISRFAEGGYQVAEVNGFDLFPHTHHMEAVALLTSER